MEDASLKTTISSFFEDTMNQNAAGGSAVQELKSIAHGACSSKAFDYTPRRTKARAVVAVNGYRLKPYEMYFDENSGHSITDDELKSFIGQCLPAGSNDPLEHGVGFAIIHFARDGNYLLLSRWYGGNMLKHDLFEMKQSPAGWQTASLQSTGIVACVWELQVIAFERQAWVCTAMAKGGTEASFHSYLSTTLEGWV
jgi:hypothetical protein